MLRDGFAAQLAGAQLSFKQFAQHHLSCLMAAHPGTAAAGVAAEEAIERVLAAWASADLFPDVPPALRALHAGGLKLAVLTNGSGGPRLPPLWEQLIKSRPRVLTLPACLYASAALVRQRSACTIPHMSRVPLKAPSRPPPAADLIARRALQKAGLEGAFAALLDIQAAGAWKPSPSSYAHAVRELGLRPEEVMLVASHPWDVFGALQASRGASVRAEAGLHMAGALPPKCCAMHISTRTSRACPPPPPPTPPKMHADGAAGGLCAARGVGPLPRLPAAAAAAGGGELWGAGGGAAGAGVSK